MRRPEKTGGVIRPRTLGLGKPAAVPEPTPPPPPPPNALVQNKRIVYAALLGFVFLCLLYFSGRGNEAVAPALNKIEVNSDTSLRTSFSNNLNDDEGDDEGETAVAPRKKSIKEDDDDEEEEESSKEDLVDEETEEEANEESDSEVKEEPQRPAPARTVVTDTRQKIADANRDKSKTVESYFVNFGGRVVEIDKEGSYKYVLVRMEDIFGGQALLVRGCPHKEGTHCKHGDAFARAKTELELRGFKASVLGGGRITRHPSRHQKGQKEGYISVFGYSKTFGACEDCNKIACSLIKASFSDYGVKWANEGYLESDERKIRDEAWTRC